MIERSFPAFLFAAPGATWPSIHDTLAKLRRLKAETLVITDRSNCNALAGPGRCLCLPLKLARPAAPAEDLFTPVPYIVPAQLFAACLAEERGLDPDRPRTISKVTQTL
jgi:glucosamine--fructose-6-phosphate aminotransferase (isomerizing)